LRYVLEKLEDELPEDLKNQYKEVLKNERKTTRKFRRTKKYCVENSSKSIKQRKIIKYI
jgi:hypothetical protein